ncbi:type II secretion system F family protein [Candidatus Wolfebacteria bacterium]|nr:type II secretion system F family protein [Candidatus Wolfebacteria bacterium]
MKYHYSASQPNGKLIEGDFEAENTAEVLIYLDSQNLKPISLKPVKGFEKTTRWQIFTQPITIEDKIFLTKYMALMLKVGTDLFKVINILIADFEKPAMKAMLSEIRSTLERGQPFYSAFVKYPKIFSSVFINLVKAGESSGKLEYIFNKLSISLKKEADLKTQIKSAVTYPIVLLCGSVIILFVLVSFALPKIANVFSGGDIKIPAFSRIIFAVGIFVGNNIWIILALLVILAFAVWYSISKTVIGGKIILKFSYQSPLIGNVLKKIALQRFASTLSSLLSAGMPIIDALEITANVVGYSELKNSLLRIANEGISRGLTIGDAFRREGTIPRVIVNLMAISEKTGSIENILATLADFYESEIESSIKSLVSFLEPILLLLIGLVIAALALAIIVPIYQLVRSF